MFDTKKEYKGQEIRAVNAKCWKRSANKVKISNLSKIINASEYKMPYKAGVSYSTSMFVGL